MRHVCEWESMYRSWDALMVQEDVPDIICDFCWSKEAGGNKELSVRVRCRDNPHGSGFAS